MHQWEISVLLIHEGQFSFQEYLSTTGFRECFSNKSNLFPDL